MAKSFHSCGLYIVSEKQDAWFLIMHITLINVDPLSKFIHLQSSEEILSLSVHRIMHVLIHRLVK